MLCPTCHNLQEHCRCRFSSASPESPNTRTRSSAQLSQTLSAGDLSERAQQAGHPYFAQQRVLRLSPSHVPTRKRDIAQAEAAPLLQAPSGAQRGSPGTVPRSRSQTAPIPIPGSPSVGVRSQPRRSRLVREQHHVRPAAVIESLDRRTTLLEPSTGSGTSNGQGRSDRSGPRHDPPASGPRAAASRAASTSLLGDQLRRNRPRGASERMEFWLEWHVTVGPRNPTDWKPDNDAFQQHVARAHNSAIHHRHPPLDEPQSRGRGSPWNLRIEDTSSPTVDSLANAELTTPLFSLSQNWRDHIEATWSFLSTRLRTGISTTPELSIFISPTPTLNLTECIRLAQAIIHFEAAVMTFVPTPCRRNWEDNPFVGPSEKTQLQVINMLDHLLESPSSNDTEKFQILNYLINPPSDDPAASANKSEAGEEYLWNLRHDSVVNDLHLRLTANVFDVPGWGTTWPQFAISFVQAAIRCDCSAMLLGYAPDPAGLRRFLVRDSNATVVVGPSDVGTLQSVEVATGRVVRSRRGWS